MNLKAIRQGFVLILLALLSGFFVPAMTIPRLGLSAHTIGILSGVLLIAVGVVWAQFRLSPRQLAIVFWGWVYSSYANWAGCLIGAALGAGKMTPVAAAGAVGPDFAELLVTVLLVSVGITSLAAAGLSSGV